MPKELVTATLRIHVHLFKEVGGEKVARRSPRIGRAQPGISLLQQPRVCIYGLVSKPAASMAEKVPFEEIHAAAASAREERNSNFERVLVNIPRRRYLQCLHL
jgi:hypothetical protein